MSKHERGAGRLFTDPDPDTARAVFRDKSRALTDKVMSVPEAVSRFVHDGDYLASGGFGANRIATAVLHEILRQGPQDLGFAGHTTTHDFQILTAGNLDGKRMLARVDAAYIVGLEARGLSPQARRVMLSCFLCSGGHLAYRQRLIIIKRNNAMSDARQQWWITLNRFLWTKTCEPSPGCSIGIVIEVSA